MWEQGNQVPPQVQDATNDQVSVNHQAIKIGEVREHMFQKSKAITTITQAIMAQDNWEVVPREKKHSFTMASRLRFYEDQYFNVLLIES